MDGPNEAFLRETNSDHLRLGHKTWMIDSLPLAQLIKDHCCYQPEGSKCLICQRFCRFRLHACASQQAVFVIPGTRDYLCTLWREMYEHLPRKAGMPKWGSHFGPAFQNALKGLSPHANDAYMPDLSDFTVSLAPAAPVLPPPDNAAGQSWWPLLEHCIVEHSGGIAFDFENKAKSCRALFKHVLVPALGNQLSSTTRADFIGKVRELLRHHPWIELHDPGCNEIRARCKYCQDYKIKGLQVDTKAHLTSKRCPVHHDVSPSNMAFFD
eukprot:TRINITY_DN4770_c0_g1_i1.p1 TRINITY_DN4770_c0_g1~~TRINITY_DN4770_c0_g1_i1.p1  ORF type:complete len:268 (+),score=8.28 TRINITY_DN4770_c0_g1_i1:102-905(+)